MTVRLGKGYNSIHLLHDLHLQLFRPFLSVKTKSHKSNTVSLHKIVNFSDINQQVERM